jgi:two-component system nitrate/nitrite response regulator NarL
MTGMAASGVRLLVIEDCRLVREALIAMLEANHWTTAVIGAATFDEVAHLCESDPPAVVLVGMGGDRGVHQLRVLRNRLPTTPLIALAVGGSDQEIIDCAIAGASGLLDRDADQDALRDAVHSVLRGDAACTPGMTAALLRGITTLTAPVPTVGDGAHLTPREREVLILIERGWTNKQIATELGVELRTVKNHVHHLLDKLRVSRRGEAAAKLRSARVPSTDVLRAALPGHSWAPPGHRD